MPIGTKSSKINISKEIDTKLISKKISSYLINGDIIFLYGEIGVGKTTFIRYLINKFQKLYRLETTEVTSPTFNLLNEYQINELKINHYDLFRLKSAEEIRNLDLFEENKNIITLVEWPQMIKEKPKNLIELVFEYGKDHKTRSVQIKGL